MFCVLPATGDVCIARGCEPDRRHGMKGCLFREILMHTCALVQCGMHSLPPACGCRVTNRLCRQHSVERTRTHQQSVERNQTQQIQRGTGNPPCPGATDCEKQGFAWEGVVLCRAGGDDLDRVWGRAVIRFLGVSAGDSAG